MLLRHLFEAPQKTAVFAFGRMNPPTIGHQKLVEKIKSVPGEHFVFLSQTQKPKTDPLDFATKAKLATAFFPDVTVGSQDVRTIIQAMQKLESAGYTDIVYVAGSDRVEAFDELLQKYNGKDYSFNSIQVINAGARDPDKDGADGMSASKMRNAAATGNFEAFVQGVPDKKLAKTMYDAVRAGMGVKDLVTAEDAEQQTVPAVSSQDLEALEKYLDRLFSKLNIDINFTRHFLDRVNDPRNKRNITIDELSALFRHTYRKWGKKIAQMDHGAQAVINSMSSDINVPFVLNWDRKAKELDLIAKTTLRKKNFTTSNQILQVENTDEAAYEGNIGIMELMQFFSKAKDTDPDLVATVKKLISQKKDREVWRIVQDYTGTKLKGNEFTGENIKEMLIKEATRTKKKRLEKV